MSEHTAAVSLSWYNCTVPIETNGTVHVVMVVIVEQILILSAFVLCVVADSSR